MSVESSSTSNASGLSNADGEIVSVDESGYPVLASSSI